MTFDTEIEVFIEMEIGIRRNWKLDSDMRH